MPFIGHLLQSFPVLEGNANIAARPPGRRLDGKLFILLKVGSKNLITSWRMCLAHIFKVGESASMSFRSPEELLARSVVTIFPNFIDTPTESRASLGSQPAAWPAFFVPSLSDLGAQRLPLEANELRYASLEAWMSHSMEDSVEMFCMIRLYPACAKQMQNPSFQAFFSVTQR